MSRSALVFWEKKMAGILSEMEDGFIFQYDTAYLEDSSNRPISFTLPLQKEPLINKTMFPFFDGLIPEGWLLDIAQQTWKLNPRDRMGLLLTCCKDCIGIISIIPEEGHSDETD